MRCEKWIGAGNVYLIVERGIDEPPLAPGVARTLCDVRAGIGADGVLELAPSTTADVAMRIVNPDGSDAEACGNGTRMVARYVGEREGLSEVSIDTVAGHLSAVLLADGRVTARLVDARLSSPAYTPSETPFPYEHRFVSVGNPHCVIQVESPARFPFDSVGAALERHPWFPQRTNVEVYRRSGPNAVEVRVWERGVGETRACGSGACAVAVAAVLDGTVTSPVTVHLPGGALEIAVSETLEVRMTGDASRIARIDVDESVIGARLG